MMNVPEPQDLEETEADQFSREVEEAAESDRPYVLHLKKPIVLQSGEPIERLTFAPLEAGHMADLPVDKSRMVVGDFLKIAVKLTGQPPRVVHKVRGDDWVRVVEIVATFMGGSPATGE